LPRASAQPIGNRYQYMTPARALPKVAGRVEFDPAYNILLPAEEAENPVNELLVLEASESKNEANQAYG
jgi:hypothetical protein